jgi:ketosteroid isomerase-like protein
MLQEHPNVTAVRDGFEAVSSGDLDRMNEAIADDVVWHVGGTSKLAGTYRGKQEVMDLFRRQDKVLANARIEPHDIVGNDQHVIAIGTATAQDPDGGSVEWRWANVFHIENGKLKEAWGLSEDPSAIDALIDKLS